MRLLAVCSLGGAGHLGPLTAFLDAAARRGDITAALAPVSMASHVEAAGVDHLVGDEPPETVVAAIREQLPVASPGEARVLAERELFARLAAGAMLPAARDAFNRWRPDLVLRDPCEWASALARPDTVAAAQVAVTFATGEAACLDVAAPVLEAQRPGVIEEVQVQPYLTAFPASVDPSPWATTIRYSRPAPKPAAPLPDWWGTRQGPLVHATLGTVTGYLQSAAAIYRALADALGALPVRVLLTTGGPPPTGRDRPLARERSRRGMGRPDACVS